MPLQVSCPWCQTALSVPDSGTGQPFTCPSCRKPITITGQHQGGFDFNGPPHQRRSIRSEPLPWFYPFAKFCCYLGIGVGTVLNLGYASLATAAISQGHVMNASTKAGALAMTWIIAGIIEILVFFLPTALLILVDIGEVQRRQS